MTFEAVAVVNICMAGHSPVRFPLEHLVTARTWLLPFSLHLHAQKLLESLGAWKLKTLGFRDAWGFIGQMGIDGITTLEKVLHSCWCTIPELCALLASGV